MVDDCNTTIMELFEQTKDVPLSLANPIRIPPRSVVVALVECNRPLHAHMDIKGDAGFLREYPNIHVSRTYVNNLTKSSKRGDYIARRDVTLNIDQLMNCEEKHECESFSSQFINWSIFNVTSLLAI